MIRAVSPMPLPVLTLSSSISHRLVSSTLLEGVMRDPLIYHEPWTLIKSSQQHQEPIQAPVQVYKSDSPTALDKVLERKGLLASPIKLRLASPNQIPLYLPTSSASTSTTHPGLVRSHTSGIFTPELVGNPTGAIPEPTTSTITSESNGYFPKTNSEINQPCSRTSSPTSVYSENSSITPLSKDKEAWLTPENPTYQEAKLSVSPARHFLRRRGPIPTTQPLSSKLLRSIVSSPPEKPRSVQSISHGLESDAELSDHLELLCPGDAPIEQYVLQDAELELALLARSEPLRIVCEALSRRSNNSSASTSMTDLTGCCSSSSP